MHGPDPETRGAGRVMGRAFVLCVFAQVLGEVEILAIGKMFPKLGELGKTEVCGCHRHAGALCVFLSFPFFCASPSVLSFYINIYICQRPFKG